MHQFLEALGFGLVTSSILAFSAVAFSIQYGVSNLPNFAHGELLTVGAYAALVAQTFTSNLLVQSLVAATFGGIAAWAMNWGVVEPFIKAGAKSWIVFVATIGVALIIENSVLLIFGGTNVVYVLPGTEPHHVGPFLWTSRDEMIIVASIVTMLLVHLLLKYTKFGKALRAVGESRELARLRGIDASRVVQLTWGLAGIIAGLGGFILAGSVGSFAPGIGLNFLLVTFAAAVVGGIGKPYGAMGGALIIGLAMEISAFYLAADYKLPVAFGVLILTLLVRPDGLFTTSRRASRG
jgi:branched-subunit amino acid ABC-type transport system permease component